MAIQFTIGSHSIYAPSFEFRKSNISIALCMHACFYIQCETNHANVNYDRESNSEKETEDRQHLYN